MINLYLKKSDQYSDFYDDDTPDYVGTVFEAEMPLVTALFIMIAGMDGFSRHYRTPKTIMSSIEESLMQQDMMIKDLSPWDNVMVDADLCVVLNIDEDMDPKTSFYKYEYSVTIVDILSNR